ncbi:hypothetical protein HBI56_055500 [Parastagonospora nodorum]|nr:hypothetical protein HBH56_096620 [Parastagonospora nodorum]KAH3930236.1 hypothetical protein HBH54_110940 [Parastagonospora nodorum]KAH3981411.1 hypothetical protein HBH52_084390 [Parastagonospora nodorum]KAH4003151.1 hypothetical protein HBI10_068480 [Parastagonospora nodorum]KAH4028054.1 hypothetical protein HBI13_049540 [Parastagonospora nodorum]
MEMQHYRAHKRSKARSSSLRGYGDRPQIQFRLCLQRRKETLLLEFVSIEESVSAFAHEITARASGLRSNIV